MLITDFNIVDTDVIVIHNYLISTLKDILHFFLNFDNSFSSISDTVSTPQELLCEFGSGIYSVQVMVVVKLCLNYKSCVCGIAIHEIVM